RAHARERRYEAMSCFDEGYRIGVQLSRTVAGTQGRIADLGQIDRRYQTTGKKDAVATMELWCRTRVDAHAFFACRSAISNEPLTACGEKGPFCDSNDAFEPACREVGGWRRAG